MATQALATENFVKVLSSEAVKKRFNEVLEKGAAAFMSALIWARQVWRQL